MRRPRLQEWGRRLVRETKLDTDNLIWPLFVREGDGAPEPVEALPGVSRLSVTDAVDHARRARDLGIPAIALFPRIDADDKDEDGSRPPMAAILSAAALPPCVKQCLILV